MISQDGLVHLFNDAAGKISGWPPKEAMALDYRLVLPLVDDKGQPIPDIVNPFAKALTSGETVRDHNCTLAAKDNRKIPLSIIISPVRDEQGQPKGSVVAVFRDIAKEKEEEA